MPARMWLQLRTTIGHGNVSRKSRRHFFVPTFLDRLMRVIDDRKPYAWAAALGWNKGTIARVMKGHIPGGELLVPVSWAENVRLDWLLMGRGTPYFVAAFADDATAAQALRYHFEDSSDWQIQLLAGPRGRFAVALTMPAELEFKGTTVRYTAVELLVGNLGDQVRQAVEENRKGRSVVVRRMEPEAWAQLQIGEIGTYRLTEQREQLFTGPEIPYQYEANHIRPHSGAVAEEPAVYENMLVLTAAEHQLLAHYQELPRTDRQVIEQLLERLRSTKPSV